MRYKGDTCLGRYGRYTGIYAKCRGGMRGRLRVVHALELVLRGLQRGLEGGHLGRELGGLALHRQLVLAQVGHLLGGRARARARVRVRVRVRARDRVRDMDRVRLTLGSANRRMSG